MGAIMRFFFRIFFFGKIMKMFKALFPSLRKNEMNLGMKWMG